MVEGALWPLYEEALASFSLILRSMLQEGGG